MHKRIDKSVSPAKMSFWFEKQIAYQLITKECAANNKIKSRNPIGIKTEQLNYFCEHRTNTLYKIKGFK